MFELIITLQNGLEDKVREYLTYSNLDDCVEYMNLVLHDDIPKYKLINFCFINEIMGEFSMSWSSTENRNYVYIVPYADNNIKELIFGEDISTITLYKLFKKHNFEI